MKINIDEIIKKIYQYPTLKEADLNLLKEQHHIVNFPKGAFLLKKGQIAKSYYILLDGIIRSYVTNADGMEITTSFYGKYDLVIEVASIFTQTPTQENVQTLSDTTLLEISYDDFQELFLNTPAIAEWGRMWMTFSLTQTKERMLNMITVTAQKRYEQLVASHPEILQNVPLKYIASYLGITDTSLSRIRKEFSK